MHDAREHWDRQADQMQEAATNPLGALAGALSSALFSASAIEEVDRYAQTNCGMPVLLPAGGLDIPECRRPATSP